MPSSVPQAKASAVDHDRSSNPGFARGVSAGNPAPERFDALVSCLTSRTGVPKDAWAVDHDAHLRALKAARDAGVSHVVWLSAICVQKPLLWRKAA